MGLQLPAIRPDKLEQELDYVNGIIHDWESKSIPMFIKLYRRIDGELQKRILHAYNVYVENMGDSWVSIRFYRPDQPSQFEYTQGGCVHNIIYSEKSIKFVDTKENLHIISIE